jgi:hypothetical protein
MLFLPELALFIKSEIFTLKKSSESRRVKCSATCLGEKENREIIGLEVTNEDIGLGLLFSG